MPESEVLGPVDYVLLEFHEDRLTGRAAAAVADLVERGIIAIYDLVVVGRTTQGDVYSLDLADTAGEAVGVFRDLAGAQTGLLDEEDLAAATAALEPGTLAVLIVYENLWAVPFVAAALESGGEVIASARIPATDLMAALETWDARRPAEMTS
ncbi:DUF6325 family protein [Trujillonella endophytica]|uniref:DUF1269 domain-containing protein n=1 Tax=Trujillonella endophytica TaxID=673521 RepID=A0A1H8TZN0_9ACTN|nr:DUF6325 family protein [Trujillella endophytica]SEO96337.1 hypothetical protein SAMN05660991_02570 [Trujillella endophytica]